MKILMKKEFNIIFRYTFQNTLYSARKALFEEISHQSLFTKKFRFLNSAFLESCSRKTVTVRSNEIITFYRRFIFFSTKRSYRSIDQGGLNSSNFLDSVIGVHTEQANRYENFSAHTSFVPCLHEHIRENAVHAGNSHVRANTQLHY